jgi:hypothetical protein
MKFKFLTEWSEKELVCCCLVKNKCDKNHNCEELEFTLNPYEGVVECMKERSYRRVRGALKQR